MGEVGNDEIELSLGLSLNGRFGVNKKSLILGRSSSSIPNLNFLDISPEVKQERQQEMLMRTSSLPLEVEEETRKRKEMQMVRRMEAKRKRTDKHRRESGVLEAAVCQDGSGFERKGEKICGFERKGEKICGFERKGEKIDGFVGYGYGGGGGGGDDRGSSGSGSSGISELDSQTPPPPPPTGANKSPEAKSPQSVQSSDHTEARHVSRDGETTKPKRSSDDVIVNSKLKQTRSVSGMTETARNVLAEMPCVSTKDIGPNGKRIEGFLYRYRKGEEVRIVCVCHGNFLTPAEFIKHAGGGDVENPLKHIVVNPTPF